jgi:hypothetical protein
MLSKLKDIAVRPGQGITKGQGTTGLSIGTFGKSQASSKYRCNSPLICRKIKYETTFAENHAVQQVERLFSLFLDQSHAKPVFLLGAGASLKSGIPLSEQIVEIATKWAYCRSTGVHPDDPSIRRSDWLEWVIQFPWYKRDAHSADNYSEVIHHLLRPREDRREFFLKLTRPAVLANRGYGHLLDLMDQRRIDTVLTTNFDTVLPNLQVTRRRPHVLESISTPSDYVKFSTSPNRPQLIYLHGSVEHYTDLNLLQEVQRLDEDLVGRLTPFLRDHPLVVLGYRGAEPSIMLHLLAEQATKTNRFAHGIFWCILKGSNGNVHPLVASLEQQLQGNLEIIEIDGFDETLDLLAGHCAKLPRATTTLVPTGDIRSESELPFDLRITAGATAGDLDWTRVQAQLVAYCREMQIDVPSRISREWLITKMRDLELVRNSGEKFAITNAGYLLFAQVPQRHIPGSLCNLKINGNEAMPIQGNLWSQLETIQNAFDEMNAPFRLKGQISETVYPYPRLALKELLVNAFVHRRYDTNEPLNIEIDKNFVKLVNPGGLVEQVFNQVKANLQEKIELGFRGIRGYRNPVLADVFYGAGAMDKKGSGLPDVHVEVTRNEGKVFFGPLDGNNAFRALVYRRKEHIDIETKTAARAAVTSKYFANLLEIIGVPDYLWMSETDCSGAGEIYRRAEHRLLPPFVYRRPGSLATFADLSSVTNPFESSIKIASIVSIPTTELASSAAGERHLVELFNRAFAKFAESRGLCVDLYRKRCYFPRTENGPHEVRYKASFRQATRTVTKPILSKKSGQILYWQHEAFWFGFERFGSEWALHLLPTYVFTKDGETTLLHHSRVGALATRMSARDFNMQVFNDLVFWAWVFSGEADFFEINLGDDHALTVRSAWLTCELEVPPSELDIDPNTSLRYDESVTRLEDEIAEAAEAELAEGELS